ncbi:MAG: M23 family metallopeptidase [Bacteroidales bacterium]|jgi:murein DD-endopeptidase MepM/ murein hydrolase activator NlpD|nr:M23 family metallopeptidase [Bacteroidales bacterium]
MAKGKYKYNPESLSFDKIRGGVKNTLIRVFTFVTASVSVIVLCYLVLSLFIGTPKERILSREVDQMNRTNQALSEKLDQWEIALNDMRQRDDNIYRTVFEAEPIPLSIRQAGYSKIRRYEDLESYSNTELIAEVSQRLDKITRQMYLQSKSYDELMERAKEQKEILLTRPAIQPIDNKDLKRTASGYGDKIHPIYGTKFFHKGMDFTAPIGTDIYATGDGVVVQSYAIGDGSGVPTGVSAGFGNRIVIDHGYGYQTLYAHMDKLEVKKGQKVKRGQVIGTVGNSGVSTGPHLHYEIHKNGKPVNPIHYYYNDLGPEGYALILDLANVGKTFD